LKINSAIIKAKKLIDGKQKNETFLFVDWLGELKSTFESGE
jgi:hypothetical protein